eukprot:scaffold50788_cov68-Phaeocystis_antarctica.AAC.7
MSRSRGCTAARPRISSDESCALSTLSISIGRPSTAQSRSTLSIWQLAFSVGLLALGLPKVWSEGGKPAKTRPEAPRAAGALKKI